MEMELDMKSIVFIIVGALAIAQYKIFEAAEKA